MHEEQRQGRDTADCGTAQIKPARIYEKADSSDDDHVKKKKSAYLCNLQAPERPPPHVNSAVNSGGSSSSVSRRTRSTCTSTTRVSESKTWLKRKTTRRTNSACYAMWKRRRARSKGRGMHKKIGGKNKRKEPFLFFSGPIGDRFKGCDVISSSLGPCWLVPLLRMAPCLRWKNG